jgi:hypothetical protein
VADQLAFFEPEQIDIFHEMEIQGVLDNALGKPNVFVIGGTRRLVEPTIRRVASRIGLIVAADTCVEVRL